MDHMYMCPRCEVCTIYRGYVDETGDDVLAVVKSATIDNTEYFSCHALNIVEKVIKEGKLPDIKRRMEKMEGCLLIHEANRRVEKRRHDF